MHYTYSRILLIITFALLLTACGGGGGGGGGGSEGGGGGGTPPNPDSRSFTVTLDSIDITRVSNGDAVVVDTSAITSGELDYNP